MVGPSLVASAFLLAPPQFLDEVRAAGEAIQPVLESNQALLRDGKLAESNQALFDFFPESNRTAAQCFLLGNLLFQLDPAKSWELHKKAYELASSEGSTQYEWALELHRKRDYAKAEKLYAELVKKEKEPDPRVHALHADCLLRLGRYAEAVAEWKAADPRNRHTSIEQGFSWVYGAPHPLVERVRLLALARGGDASAAESLVLLDLSWTTDWWNSETNEEYLELDLPVAAKALGADSRRYRELALLAEVTPREDPLRSERPAKRDVSPASKKLVGKDVPLAENSRVASDLLHRAVVADVATSAELLEWYEAPLRARATSEAGDARALESLAALYEDADRPRELAELEELGWKKYGAVECVAGILARRAATLTADDPLLLEAIAKFPDAASLRTFAVQCAQREKKDELEAVAAYVAAHLTHMVSYLDGAKNGFAALERLTAPR